MAAFDPVFNGAGAAAGLECWRIENKKPVKFEGGASPAVTGKFHAGDSYLLLNTVDTKSGLRWDLHFWLGEESSQDEIGIAAYKVEARPATLLPDGPLSHTTQAVELDDSLGGAPIQHRETQGNESNLFMSYYKQTGVEYLPGGVESGFVKVRLTPRPQPIFRLFVLTPPR